MDRTGSVEVYSPDGRGAGRAAQWILIPGALLFATVALMMLYREVLLPMVLPEISFGLFAGDPIYIHCLAVDLVADMKAQGWSAWTLRPAGQAPAGILAALYYFTGPDSRGIIPVNAILHVIGTLALYGVVTHLVSWKPAVLVCVPYWISPYHMALYAQPNKDSFAGAGALLLVYGWVRITDLFLSSPSGITKSWVYALCSVIAGTVLMGIVRPYMVSIALVMGIACFCCLAVRSLGWYRLEERSRRMERGMKLAGIAFILLASIPLSWSDFEEKAQESRMEFVNHSSATELWRPMGWIPQAVENKVAAIVVAHRGSFRDFLTDRNQASRDALIDMNHGFENMADVAAYFPRAAQIGFFAPFPNQWSFFGFPSRSVFWNVSAWQMLSAYGAYALLIWGVVRLPERPTLMVAIGFAVLFMLFYAFAVPHLGNLDRYRYPWLCLLTTLGVACGVRCWQRRKSRAGAGSCAAQTLV